MYDGVPDFSTEEDYPFINSSGFIRMSKSSMFEPEELMELVWQNDKILFNTQSQKNKNNDGVDAVTIAPLQRPTTDNGLFIHEDEMASWLTSYPTAETATASAAAAIAADATSFAVSGPSISNNPTVARDSTTMIGSNETPVAAEPRGWVSSFRERVGGLSGESGTSTSTCAELPPRPRLSLERKGKPTGDVDSELVQDTELEVPDAKKQVHGSPPTKRSRAAEVHNLSERRRRDRINEKMKALQDLIPRCNKTDKASMLDDAIEYLKSLQQTVQMMSMGYGMVPVMYSGVQQYMPSIPMRMPIETVTNKPMMLYPLRAPLPFEHLRPAFPVPSFRMPLISLPNPTIPQNLHPLQAQNEPQISNFNLSHLYHQAQVALAQNQATMQQSNSKPKSIGEVQKYEDTHYSGSNTDSMDR